MLGINANVTKADIEFLAAAAEEAGDHETAKICRDALAGDTGAWYACGEHILNLKRREPDESTD